MNGTDDDTKLMLRLREGERSAFDELYRRYSKKIYNYLLRFSGNAPAAEDLTQEVFVKMYVSAKTYEPTAKVSTWLFTIASHLAVNEYHKNKRLIFDNREPQSGILTEEAVMMNDMEQGLLRCIQELPPNQKEAMLLRSVEGMDYEEIARALSTSVKAVKSLLNRAREKLSDAYKKHMVQD